MTTPDQITEAVERVERLRARLYATGDEWLMVREPRQAAYDLRALLHSHARQAEEIGRLTVERDAAAKIVDGLVWMSQRLNGLLDMNGALDVSGLLHLAYSSQFRAEAAEAQIAALKAVAGEGGMGASRDHEPTTSSALDKAIRLAATAHAGQTDRGGAPYILHPLRVMMALDGEDSKVVGVLHDVLEDCPGYTVETLRAAGFSERVTDALVALTRRRDETYPEFIERVAVSCLARRVKLADLADNSDLSRIPNPGASDRARVAKYARAIAFLSSATGSGAPAEHRDDPKPCSAAATKAQSPAGKGEP